METFDASELKARLGEVLARGSMTRVAIRRHGKVVAYLVPAREFEKPKAERPVRAARSLSREQEERLLALCASGDFRPSRWRRAGDARLLAGVAAMLASVDMFDRPKLFALAERLHPGMSTMEGYSAWLRNSPVKPYRFLPMLRARLKGQA